LLPQPPLTVQPPLAAAGPVGGLTGPPGPPGLEAPAAARSGGGGVGTGGAAAGTPAADCDAELGPTPQGGDLTDRSEGRQIEDPPLKTCRVHDNLAWSLLPNFRTQSDAADENGESTFSSQSRAMYLRRLIGSPREIP